MLEVPCRNAQTKTATRDEGMTFGRQLHSFAGLTGYFSRVEPWANDGK